MSHFTQSFCKKMSHFARHGHKKMCQILLAIVGPVPKFWGNGERGCWLEKISPPTFVHRPPPLRAPPHPSARRTLVSSYSKKLAELCGGYNEVRLREVLHVACDKFCVPRNRGAVEHLVVRIREWLV